MKKRVSHSSKLFFSALLLSTLGFCVPSAFADDQWFCRQGSSQRLGEVLESCGIGKSTDEAEARKKALDGAFEEFDHICRESADCRDYEKTVEPMRTECIKGKDAAYTCYRALDFTVTHQKKEKSFDDKDKQEAIVSAINQNEGANPALSQTGSPPPPSESPSIYRNVHYSYVTGYDPYIYVISSRPQVVYVRSQLPPQYLPAPPAPVHSLHPAPPPGRPSVHKVQHSHPNNKNRVRKKPPVQKQTGKKSKHP